jgi:N6-adenosine-specific RNA methylase IME4
MPTTYTTIVADPPWLYDDKVNAANAKAGVGRRGAEGRYPCMRDYEIGAALLEASLEHRFTIAHDSHLYLWATNSFLREAFEVMKAWGYSYKTTITWVKSDGIGMGSYFRNTTEHCLFGVRGRLPLRSKSIPTHFEAPRPRYKGGPHDAGTKGQVIHSAKPPIFNALVMAASPGLYLDMFAPDIRHGPSWGCVGYDFYSPANPSSMAIRP